MNPLAGSGLGASDVVLSVAIVAAGSALQASIGFGVALVAAPLLVVGRPVSDRPPGCADPEH